MFFNFISGCPDLTIVHCIYTVHVIYMYMYIHLNRQSLTLRKTRSEQMWNIYILKLKPASDLCRQFVSTLDVCVDNVNTGLLPRVVILVPIG